MLRPEFTFRQAQAAFDLISTVQGIDDTKLIKVGGDALVHIVRNSSCRFENESEEACYARLFETAIDAEDGAAVAVAVLVANDLQRGLWQGQVKELAEMAADKLRRANPMLLKSVLRGIDALDYRRFNYEPFVNFLPSESRLTLDKEQILPELCRIARAMDDDDRKAVAAADYGYRKEEHFLALNDVLARDDCRFHKDNYWCPSEVVELTSHGGSDQTFISCTALLLVNALVTKDRMGWFDYRWERYSVNYNMLSDNVRPAIISGIRWLYESGYCEPSFGDWDPIKFPQTMIPIGDLSQMGGVAPIALPS